MIATSPRDISPGAFAFQTCFGQLIKESGILEAHAWNFSSINGIASVSTKILTIYYNYEAHRSTPLRWAIFLCIGGQSAGKEGNREPYNNRQPEAASGHPAERRPGTASIYLGNCWNRKIEYRGAVRRASGPALCVPAGQPAGPGGYHRRAPDHRRAERVLPAQDDRPGRALLPVPGRAQRLLSGGAEGLLLPDPGAPGGGVPSPRGLHRGGSGQPGPGQRHHPAHVLRPAQPHVPCGAAGGCPALAGVGGPERHPSLDLRLHLHPAGSALEPAAQDGGALLHAPELAHAQ